MTSKISKCVNCDKQFSTKQALDYHLKKAVCTSKDNSDSILSHITVIENLVKKVEELTIDVSTLKIQLAKQQEIIDNLKKDKKSPSNSKKSPPKTQRKDIKFQYGTLNDTKWGDLIYIKNFKRLFICKEESETFPVAWAYCNSLDKYKETKEIEPIYHLQESTRDQLTEVYGLEFDKNEYNNRLDVIEEMQELNNLGISKEEFEDTIDELGNQIIEGKGYTRLDSFGIGMFSFRNLYQVKQNYNKWKDENKFDNDEDEYKEKKKYIYCELRHIDSYYVDKMSDKYRKNIYIFLEEMELSVDEFL